MLLLWQSIYNTQSIWVILNYLLIGLLISDLKNKKIRLRQSVKVKFFRHYNLLELIFIERFSSESVGQILPVLLDLLIYPKRHYRIGVEKFHFQWTFLFKISMNNYELNFPEVKKGNK